MHSYPERERLREPLPERRDLEEFLEFPDFFEAAELLLKLDRNSINNE